MFMGDYNHTIDATGTPIIPSKFRAVLGDEFVVTTGMDGWWRDGLELRSLVAFAEDMDSIPRAHKEGKRQPAHCCLAYVSTINEQINKIKIY